MYNVHINVQIVWDDTKNVGNMRKHGVSFVEAATVFRSVPLQIFHDPDHSEGENRYIAVGFSDRGRVLLVVHCENHKGNEIRIISARRATRKEQVQAFGELR